MDSNSCTSIFKAALFTIGPKCEATQGSIDTWTDNQNVVYTYNRILYSFKNEKNSDTCYNMNERTIMLSEISKTQKNKHYITTVIWYRYNSQIYRDGY